MRKRKTKNAKLKANNGFTLVELIIYLAIVSVLATSLILWSLSVGDIGARARASADLNASARFAFQIITRDIEQAAAVVSPLPPTSSPTLVLTDNLGETITIGLSNNQLTRIVGSSDPLPLAAVGVSATDFSVTPVTGQWSARPSLTVNLTLRSLPAPAKTFTTTVNLRH